MGRHFGECAGDVGAVAGKHCHAVVDDDQSALAIELPFRGPLVPVGGLPRVASMGTGGGARHREAFPLVDAMTLFSVPTDRDNRDRRTSQPGCVAQPP